MICGPVLVNDKQTPPASKSSHKRKRCTLHNSRSIYDYEHFYSPFQELHGEQQDFFWSTILKTTIKNSKLMALHFIRYVLWNILKLAIMALYHRTVLAVGGLFQYIVAWYVVHTDDFYAFVNDGKSFSIVKNCPIKQYGRAIFLCRQRRENNVWLVQWFSKSRLLNTWRQGLQLSRRFIDLQASKYVIFFIIMKLRPLSDSMLLILGGLQSSERLSNVDRRFLSSYSRLY